MRDVPQNGRAGGVSEESTSFFAKKEAKKLLSFAGRGKIQANTSI
jgi:hypothetical protein